MLIRESAQSWDMPAYQHNPLARYTPLEQAWPVIFKPGIEGEPPKLLIKESWYSYAQQVYEWYQQISELASVVDISTGSLPLDTVPALPEFPMELRGLGVTLYLGRVVIAAVKWAVTRGIHLSQFKLHPGGWGASGIGWTPEGFILYREC